MCIRDRNRRWERRNDILEMLQNKFQVKEIVDLSAPENEGKFLEGTGSMIFDHDNKLAYGSVSLRLDEQLFRDFCEKFGYKPVVFHSFQTANNERLPIYHTNVMMCVADKFVVICLDCIDEESERRNAFSYTHLDVYKRQEDELDLCLLQVRFCLIFLLLHMIIDMSTRKLPIQKI